MKHDYIFLRKCVLGLVVMGTMGQVSDGLCKGYVNVPLKAKKVFGVPYDSVNVYDIEQIPQKDWSSSAWQVVNSPYFVMAMNLALPVIVISADVIRIHYWLTDEQREKILQKRSKEKQERKIFVEFQKLALSEKADAKLGRQQNLRENEILLYRAKLEDEKNEINHLKEMIQSLPVEKRTEAQEQLDAYINARIRIRLERSMSN